jgi:hypothetical protein
MTEVNATTAAINDPLPAFLSVWETDTATPTVHVFDKTKTQAAPGAYQQVQLHNFKFLGQPFVQAQYFGLDSAGNNVASFSGGGVCQEFKDRLVLAQRQIFRAYAIQQAAKGVTPSEGGFASWCAIKAPHGGWQFRGGNHRFGSAMDIDATFNPYIATRSGSVFGGELPSNTLTAIDVGALKKIRSAAIDGYRRALAFMFGDAISIPGLAKFEEETFFGEPQPGETSAQIYRRMAITSEAITWYLSTGFVANAGQRIPAANDIFPRDPVDFKQTLERNIDFKLGKTNPTLKAELNNSAKLDARLKQIAFDHDAIRKTMINGTWKVTAGQIVFDSSRDPTFGFLSLREEIVTGIRGQSLRWGAVDFGPAQNGDVMHFDLNQPPAMTVDANPKGLFFVSKVPKS